MKQNRPETFQKPPTYTNTSTSHQPTYELFIKGLLWENACSIYGQTHNCLIFTNTEKPANQKTLLPTFHRQLHCKNQTHTTSPIPASITTQTHYHQTHLHSLGNNLIQELIDKPLFINFGHRTLRQELVHTKMTPTKQFIDIVSILADLPKQGHTTSGQLPQPNVTITTCKHP